ncbi:hypothetical protein SAMN05414139_04019 [Burkholderia sp. D7]|nr:hypothetical protein SAMN05414139_04019 [Burkholderia sp. D7]
MTQASEQLLADLRASEHQFVSIRHDIHAHPELGFEETVGQLRRGSSTAAIGLRAQAMPE